MDSGSVGLGRTLRTRQDVDQARNGVSGHGHPSAQLSSQGPIQGPGSGSRKGAEGPVPLNTHLKKVDTVTFLPGPPEEPHTPTSRRGLWSLHWCRQMQRLDGPTQEPPARSGAKARDLTREGAGLREGVEPTRSPAEPAPTRAAASGATRLDLSQKRQKQTRNSRRGLWK